jgi:DNA-binding GntR family transcriptional regulator
MYEALLGRFMDGVHGAGESLNIGALSRELNVSQTPLREALARLEHTGLVHREAMKGYRVAPMMTKREISKLMEARLVLEPAMTHEAGLRTTPEFLEELRVTVEDLARSADLADTETENFRLYWRSDDRFHVLIAEHCDNPFLETAYRALGGQIQRFRLFSKLGHTGATFAATEHRAVYEALASRDPERAAELMRDHIREAQRRNAQY